MPSQEVLKISEELQRASVAASTIREALGPWREQQMLKLIADMAKAPATMEAMLMVKAEAMAFYKLTKELESVMNKGKEND